MYIVAGDHARLIGHHPPAATIRGGRAVQSALPHELRFLRRDMSEAEVKGVER